MNLLRSEKGAGLILMALSGAIVVWLLLAAIPSKVSELADEHTRLLMAISMTSAMQDASILVLDARIKGRQAEVASNMKCPNENKHIRKTINGKIYCFTKKTESGSCFTDFSTNKEIELCLDPDDITISAKGPVFKFLPQESPLEKVQRRIANTLRKGAYRFVTETKLITKAYGEDEELFHLPPDPAGLDRRHSNYAALRVSTCPNIGDYAMQWDQRRYECEYCGENNSKCLTLKIPNPHIQGEEFVQKIIIYDLG